MSEANSQLDERSRFLLKTLVDCYISDGKPVGSKTLAERAGLNISTATIRNVMASLDRLGLVEAPHTSAGRIPTDMGLRFFIDSILETKPLKPEFVQQLRQQLNPDQSQETLIESATSVLSDLTRLVGIITLPKAGQILLRHIEFLPLSDKRVLAILVINEKDVHNRVLQMDRDYSQDELTQMANFLNQNCMGRDIFDIRQHLLEELRYTQTQVDQVMQSAVEIADQALRPETDQQESYRVQGETNLIRYNTLENTRQLQRLFELFGNRQEILSLLDRCIQAEDIQVFVGREAGIEDFGDFSVVTAPYRIEGRPMGVLGVIGPTRIAYSKVIPVVDITARLLGAALKS